MGCDYYIRTELVIEFYDKDNKHCCIYTDMDFKKGYLFNYQNNNSDDDEETQCKKFQADLERIIQENTNSKILFDNDFWIKKSYRKKYYNIMKTFIQIHKLKKVYKKTYAWERT